MSSRHLLIVAVVGLFTSATHADTIYVDDDNGSGSDVTIIDAQGAGSVVTSAHSEGPGIELEGST
ncbi:MAG: hypothetical protein ACYSUI_22115, partial [Planctomycetota bacterium]